MKRKADKRTPPPPRVTRDEWKALAPARATTVRVADYAQKTKRQRQRQIKYARRLVFSCNSSYSLRECIRD